MKIVYLEKLLVVVSKIRSFLLIRRQVLWLGYYRVAGACPHTDCTLTLQNLDPHIPEGSGQERSIERELPIAEGIAGQYSNNVECGQV